MATTRKNWAIVLAAGDGTRLRTLTTGEDGVTVPKQYCRLTGGRTLLEEAIRRAARMVPLRRIVTVVSEHHRPWWERELALHPPDNVIVQPANRGTAAGVLLPLLAVVERDPEASVLVLPSDHFVEHERILARSLRRASAAVRRDRDRVVLIGMTPDAPESDYGWIVPEGEGEGGIMPVAAFVEKPDPDLAAGLLRAGGAWNSFILLAAGSALLRLYARRLPRLLDAFLSAGVATGRPRRDALTALYDSLEVRDFSRDLLQGSEESLRTLHAPACGWTDLGSPARVAECLRRTPAVGAAGVGATGLPGHGVDLSRAVSAEAF